MGPRGIALVTAVLVGLILPAAAPASVPHGYERVAAATGVPADVLYALAAAESGARLQSGRLRPWPWTLNVGGRPERYATADEALEALRGHLAAGKRNIDVGLMQVNWHWYEDRLESPEQALDPYTNLRIGAGILRDRHENGARGWLHAAGLYHAPNNERHASRHRERVAHHLERLQ
ncbi:transglycosylase SLT domain-containing protein [Thioalkalivibrio sp. ALE20]|uniref:transglycosylase SLT domain-containing protein n=1 Tax=Thioalkalivibrio sp. ALE20 TaxID=545275 RepID=UPI0003701D1D|nr:transglycosylase SLT domain-containing protein [Thioalkalivibrio sp. ALE20]